ncbi:MAG: LD-carboxypeptidase [Alphaproteobacteria bacterium]|nr:LD-carboxypeptidase [Alphaproteobacteria bacterium]MBV9370343.1 LD-carboxypeptidase [Alphaproteobacteria bacterium]MBV9902000.1 LD-carboxypeptidase [Alphaproteobacteria bacterium]
MRIAVVAPSTPILEETAARVRRLAAQAAPGVELVFHPQCFMTHNHFAGPDAVRAAAFLEAANDPGFDALWFARGGYGSCRIAEPVLAGLGPAARNKAYLGYSDAGYLLAGLYRAGFPRLAHGPMPNDLRRPGGEAAVRRGLSWLAEGEAGALEPGLGAAPALAFNITVFGQLLGTALQPSLAGHELLLEDVAEYMYRTDRAMFHITGNAAVREVAGIRLGRCSEVPLNDPDFGESEEEVFRYWCARAGIPFLGRADIGHDADNKVVPFGRRARK